METFSDLEFALKRGLGELDKFEQEPWVAVKSALRQKPMVWEKEVGRLCAEAERLLSESEIYKLKRATKLNDRQWRLYKWRFEHFPPDNE